MKTTGNLNDRSARKCERTGCDTTDYCVLVIVPSTSFERGQLNLQYKPCQYRADEIIANMRAFSQVGDMVYDPVYLYFK